MIDPITTGDDALVERLRVRLDALITAIDRRIGRQLDAILHDPAFQRLERAWRGLAFVIDRTAFEENIQVALLDCSKNDLRADLERAPDLTKSGLYHIIHTAELGREQGEPYGAIIADYVIEPDDLGLLARCGEIAHAALAPFVAAASPRLLGIERWVDVSHMKQIAGCALEAFQALREKEAMRAVGLTLPRFLLRSPFRADAGAECTFTYDEDVEDDESLCWGNASFALATRITESFARYRWCPNIIGVEAGGLVTGLVTRSVGAGRATPTEVFLSEMREFELSEAGLIPFTAREGREEACFFSANSVMAPKYYGTSEEGRAAEMNCRLGAMLPYYFVIARVGHYAMMMYRSRAVFGERPADVQNDLGNWLEEFVANRDVVPVGRRGRRFLRKLRIRVEGGESPAWHVFSLQIRPHFKFMGAFFTLTYAGTLETAR